jgi:Set1/Ash2 histone methyltransferase complex subunit ASH2
MEDMPETSATRIGWSQPLGNLQAPLGYDKFGHSWRSRKGTVFHESRGKHYANTGFGEGDVLGFLIILPDSSEEFHILPPTYKDRPLVKFKSHLYYEEKDEVQDALKQLRPLKGSKLHFFRNGVNQGVAFNDIYEGTYYPAISMYKGSTVSVNFGPNFKYPPKQFKFRGMDEAVQEAVIQQALADTIYLVENDGKLRLDQYTA